MPTSLLAITAKAAIVLPFSGPTIANTTVTNVPGPTEPIFFSGARLVRAAGLGPLVVGLNLIHVHCELQRNFVHRRYGGSRRPAGPGDVCRMHGEVFSRVARKRGLSWLILRPRTEAFFGYAGIFWSGVDYCRRVLL